jgi:hypothetical protein
MTVLSLLYMLVSFTVVLFSFCSTVPLTLHLCSCCFLQEAFPANSQYLSMLDQHLLGLNSPGTFCHMLSLAVSTVEQG